MGVCVIATAAARHLIWARVVLMQASRSKSRIVVSGLRFSGGRLTAHALPHAPGGLSNVNQQQQTQQQLNFEQEYDSATDSWTLHLAAPEGGASLPPASHVEVTCQDCLQQGRAAPLTAQLERVPIAAEGRDGAGVVVVALVGALLPTGAGWRAARSLQQAVQQTLSLGGKTYSFDNVADLSGDVGSPFKLYYTLTSDGAMSAALACEPPAPAASHYCGLGLGASMLHIPVVIVTPDSTDGYHFESISVTQVNAARGGWALTNTAAAVEDGRLVGVFSAADVKPGSQPCVFAIGPYTANKLASHTSGAGSTYGSCTLDLKVSSGIASAPSSSSMSGDAKNNVDSAPAAATSSNAASPAPAPSPATAASGATKPGPDAPTAAATAAKAAGGDAATPAATSAGDCVLRAADGTTTAYSACMLVDGIGQDFNVMWTVTPSPSNPSVATLAVGMNTSDTSRFVAMAWPASAGAMSGAQAVVLASCATCASGASLAPFHLGGYRAKDVTASTDLQLSAITATAQPGWLTGSFEMSVPACDASGARRLVRRLLTGAEACAATTSTGTYLNTPASQNLLWAAGSADGSGMPLGHTAYGDSTVNLLAASAGAGGGGAANSAGVSVASTPSSTTKNAHAWLCTIGWGVLIPAGVASARFKTVGPKAGWFQAHRALQTLGFILGTVGVGLGFEYSNGWDTPYAVHRNLGITVTVLGAVQLTALLLRPAPGTKLRPAWTFGHSWLGRSATAIAIANIYYGIINVEALGAWAWATYTAVLCCIVAAGLANEAATCMAARRSAGKAADGAGAGSGQFVVGVGAADVTIPAAEGSEAGELGKPDTSKQPSEVNDSAQDEDSSSGADDSAAQQGNRL